MKIACYRELVELEKKYPNGVRVLGPIVGIASFAGTVTARVATLGEFFITGIYYMGSAPFAKRKRDERFINGLGYVTEVELVSGLGFGLGATAKSALGIFQKTWKCATKKSGTSYFEQQMNRAIEDRNRL